MKGILLLSHGNMAKGMLQSSSLFFGDQYEQMEALDFQVDGNIIDFEKEIGEAIGRLDTGDGVIVLTDLFAGTPAHKTTAFLREGVDVICGMNFPMFLELLGMRMMGGEIDLESLMEVGREGIRPWVVEQTSSSDDDFF